MFEDPNGIPYIGTPAWKTRVTYKEQSAAERGDEEAVRAKLAAMKDHEEKPSFAAEERNGTNEAVPTTTDPAKQTV
jgi:hypothetical protein